MTQEPNSIESSSSEENDELKEGPISQWLSSQGFNFEKSDSDSIGIEIIEVFPNTLVEVASVL